MSIGTAIKNLQTILRIHLVAALILIITYFVFQNSEIRNVHRVVIVILVVSIIIQLVLFALKPALFRDKQQREESKLE